MIVGVITTKTIVTHAFTIVHEFGWTLLFSAAIAVLLRRKTTFLELVMEAK